MRRMRRSAAAAGTSLFLALAPGVTAGLVPWLITRWRYDGPGAGKPWTRWVGALVVALGAAFVLHAFIRFVVDGGGTPAPVAPTERVPGHDGGVRPLVRGADARRAVPRRLSGLPRRSPGVVAAAAFVASDERERRGCENVCSRLTPTRARAGR